MTRICTRFAPSPTGHLHIGGARTALFNWLFARHHGGRFVLRIEDTDRERSSDTFTEAILEGLDWLGLGHDEGPHFQSQRGPYYEAVVARLLEGGHAYRCFCTPEDLETRRQAAAAEGRRSGYDRTCRERGRAPRAGESFVVRLAVPLDGQTVIRDIVRGDITFENAELDDFVLVRSDGSPVFHLVNVADDLDMGITHILRGEDHITNTPRQMQIFRALGAEPPVYGHMPLIVGADRTRLSKRHGATSLLAYRDLGFLPEATINYLARLGWSHGDQEVFALDELVESFDAFAIHKSAAAWDIEKFSWVNAQHLRRLSTTELATALRPHLAARGDGGLDAAYLEAATELVRERGKTLLELVDQLTPFVRDRIEYDGDAVAKFLGAAACARLRSLAGEVEGMATFTHEDVERELRAFAEGAGVKLKDVAQPLRVALTGSAASPGIFEVCAVLGRERVVARLRAVCDGVEADTLPLRAPAGAA